MKSFKISIIIPCFNEESNILNTHKKLTSVIKKVTSKYELLFIDDASNDKTLNILKALIKKDSHVVAVSFARNFGPYGAFAAGFKYADGDAVVCIDCDL